MGRDSQTTKSTSKVGVYVMQEHTIQQIIWYKNVANSAGSIFQDAIFAEMEDVIPVVMGPIRAGQLA